MRYLLLFLPALLLTAQAPLKNFKESGSPSAPVTIELYTDYQCPHCREFYLTVLPSLNTEFIQTGKVKLVHRDFPLPQFQYSKLATLYANASGRIGRYDAVAHQLFLHQPEWAVSGDVEGAVAKILSPAELKRVKEYIASDSATMEAAIARDVAAGNQDHLNATPTIIIAKGGKRETISGGVTYGTLKSYLNEKLAE